MGAIIIFYNGNRLLLKYFDSFAESFKKYKNITRYISKIKLECLNNNLSFKLDTMPYAIQSNDSRVCGVYSAYCVIKSFANPNSLLKSNFKEFTRNRSINDKKIMAFLKKKWPPQCHNTKINYDRKLPLNLIAHIPPFCPKTTLNMNKCFKQCTCYTKCCN